VAVGVFPQGGPGVGTEVNAASEAAPVDADEPPLANAETAAAVPTAATRRNATTTSRIIARVMSPTRWFLMRAAMSRMRPR
jgi:hypothetical protein